MPRERPRATMQDAGRREGSAPIAAVAEAEEEEEEGPPRAKQAFDFQNVLNSMNNILAPVGAEVSMKKKNARTGQVEDCDQGEAVKVTNFRIQAAAAQHAMQEMSYEERRAFLLEHKAKGNALFQERKFDEACKVYMEAVSALTEGSSEEDKADATANLHVPLVNNLAACFVELGEWRRAAALSNEVLKLDAQNLKALLRKGRALKHMMEHEEATKTLRKAIVESGRAGGSAGKSVGKKAANLLKELEKSEKRHARAARNMMRSGFAAGAIYEDKKVEENEKQEGGRSGGGGDGGGSGVSGEARQRNGRGARGQSLLVEEEENYDSDDSSVYSEDENDHGTLIAHFGTAGPASNCMFCMEACVGRVAGQISGCSGFVVRWVKNWLPCRKDKRSVLRARMAAEAAREKTD